MMDTIATMKTNLQPNRLHRIIWHFAVNMFAILAVTTLLGSTTACANTGDTATVSAIANGKTNTLDTANGTNSPSKEVPVPVSVFELTEKSHDPFFPTSVRRAVADLTTNAPPMFQASSFTLKALSGSAGHRLALINNRTLATGEKTEITTATGKLVIYCEEIKENSVVIRTLAQPDPIEIFLRKTAQ